MTFKNGDRVRVTSCDGDDGYVGKTGTVSGEPRRSRILGGTVVPVEVDGIGEDMFFPSELEHVQASTIPLDADQMADIIEVALGMWNDGGRPSPAGCAPNMLPLSVERCEGHITVRVSNVAYRVVVKTA
jgi:hypothetical protein